VISDVICPWCYIGKRQLEKALNALNDRYEMTVTWRPFQLNPTMPSEGMDRQAYRAAKFGSAEAAQSRDSRVVSTGALEGILFAFDQIKRTPNTFDAHRLIWLAQRENVQDVVVERLFQSYFIEAADVGDRQTLIHIGKLAGLAESDVETFLNSDEGVDAVREDNQRSRQRGVQSVPSFQLNGVMLRSGVEDADALVRALEQAAKSIHQSSEHRK